MAETIDAHHHLWNYTETEFGWISGEMDILKNDYTRDVFTKERLDAGVDGSIVVQSRQSVIETDWLIQQAGKDRSIRGVVGWLPIASTWFPALLHKYRAHPHLKGLRHVVQDEPDPNFLLSAKFNRGISLLEGSELAYDILIREAQLPQTVAFVRQHPHQPFVIDHLAKPIVRHSPSAQWMNLIGQLGSMPQVSCKLSGLATEANWSDWTLDQLRPYLDFALEAFGAERLMAGSDWPVCLLASTYERWWATLRAWAEPLNDRQKELIFGGTAKAVYRLGAE